MGKFKPLIEEALSQPPLAYSVTDLAQMFEVSYDQAKHAVFRHNRDPKNKAKIELRDERFKVRRPEISQNTRMSLDKARKERKKINADRILVVGDLHEPFCLDMYFDFVKEVQQKYDTTHTIFIGDIIDNHYSSFHDTDADGYSARDELEIAISRLFRWVDAFPTADVCVGNHDRLIARKARTGGISALWLRNYSDVISAPGWVFKEEFVYDDVRYIHGESGTARNRAKKDLISTVQGHRHQEAYVEYIVGHHTRAFGMQVGCGVDKDSYAMAYAKAGPKPVISCGVVTDQGKNAYLEVAKL